MDDEYYVAKKVVATPMDRLTYTTYRGWELPENENGADEGYLVKYLDGGKTNHGDHVGYFTWCPKEQFDSAYQSTQAMSFGHAIMAMKEGHKVCRAGWNGKGMWIAIQEGSEILPELARGGAAKRRANEILIVPSRGEVVSILPHIDMRTAEGFINVGWLASQTDMLADDWMLLA